MDTGAVPRVLQTLTLFVVSCVVLTSGRHDEGVVNINSNQGRYKLQAYVNMVTWMQAKVVCEHEGGVLFHPRDQYEANQAKLFWDREVFSHNTGVFVGLNDLRRKGYFETIEGEPSTAVYNNWHSGEPNDVDGNEDCAILVRDALYDYHCHWRLPFICRKKFEDSSEVRFYSDLLASTPPTTEVESDDRFYSDLLTSTPPTTEVESDDRFYSDLLASTPPTTEVESDDRFYSDLLTSTPPTTEVESDDRFYSDLLASTPPTTEVESDDRFYSDLLTSTPPTTEVESDDRFYSDLLASTPPTTEVESDDRFYSDLLASTPLTTEYESIVTMSTIATVDEKSEQTVTSGAQGSKACSYYLMFVTWAVVCNLLGR
ncbi:lectin c-type domain-containing protein [Phthorimaea operculella]|nr:lectin c-type domain-containing protein [Phthorimaea operculella]